MKYAQSGRDNLSTRTGALLILPQQNQTIKIHFASAIAVLERRIKIFVELPIESLSRISLEKKVKEISVLLPEENDFSNEMK